MSLFTASDRIGRANFALQFFGCYLVFWIFLAYGVQLFGRNTVAIIIAAIAFMVLWMLWFVSMIFRRLHDLGRQASQFYLFFIPIVNIIFILDLLFTEGSRGRNQFGPPPTDFASTASRER